MASELTTTAGRAAIVAQRQSEIEAQFDLWRAEAREIVGLSELVPGSIDDEQGARDATSACAWGKGLADRIEAQRKTWGDPLRKLVSVINARCKEVQEPLAVLERDLKARLVSYESNRDEPAPTGSGRSVRSVRGFEIEDAAAIPRDYLVPDLKTLGALAKRDDPPAIPGVRWTSHKQVAIKAERGAAG